MRPTPRRWLAVLLLTLIPLVAACASSSATSAAIAAPTATAGDVTVTLDRPRYTTHQTLGVTVANGSGHAWYARDGLSACTYVQLEWYDATKRTWSPVDGCTGATTPQVRLIAPKSSLPFTLAPGDSPTDANAWVPGLYRVTVTCSASQDESPPLFTVSSAGFQIGD